MTHSHNEKTFASALNQDDLYQSTIVICNILLTSISQFFGNVRARTLPESGPVYAGPQTTMARTSNHRRWNVVNVAATNHLH